MGKTIDNKILLSTVGLLITGLGVWAYIRANTFPCYRFDSTSGCVSSVRLQTEGLNFEPDSIAINRYSFDLSSDAKLAVVGLSGLRSKQDAEDETNKSVYGAIALFDAQNGNLIRVLREVEANALWRKINNRKSEIYNDATQEVAISGDGSLIASYAFGKSESSLIVQRTDDGSLVKKIFEKGERTHDSTCYSLLEFTPDNQAIQCGSTLFQLKSDRYTRLIDEEGKSIYPRIGDVSIIDATAPDGTKVESFVKGVRIVSLDGKTKEITSSTSLSNANSHLMFSSDSQLFIQARVVRRESDTIGFLIPNSIRTLSSVAIWGSDGELQQTFYNNKRYQNLAWSRDSEYFALMNRDLTLQVFTAP